MKQLLKLLGCLFAVVLVVSCKETEEQRIARHIKYWENKETQIQLINATELLV